LRLGGVMALWIRDMDFTIAAGVGFVAVSGVSMLMARAGFHDRRESRAGSFIDAILETRLMRLRPCS
jgi:cobalt-zinc-cadmium resistance protein CzcA